MSATAQTAPKPYAGKSAMEVGESLREYEDNPPKGYVSGSRDDPDGDEDRELCDD